MVLAVDENEEARTALGKRSRNDDSFLPLKRRQAYTKQNDDTEGVKAVRVASKNKKWNNDCLNPACNQKHRVRDCSIADKETADKLLS